MDTISEGYCRSQLRDDAKTSPASFSSEKSSKSFAGFLARYSTLWRYLESGKEEMASRYLCKSRPLWYKQESRQPTPFVCTYMGRSNSASGTPFRFLLNHSQAVVANTYLMLYPKPQIAGRLHGRDDIIRGIWESLKNIHPELLMSEGRVYGGGLHKMEPKELAKVSAKEISAVLNMTM